MTPEERAGHLRYLNNIELREQGLGAVADAVETMYLPGVVFTARSTWRRSGSIRARTTVDGREFTIVWHISADELAYSAMPDREYALHVLHNMAADIRSAVITNQQDIAERQARRGRGGVL